MAATLPGLRTKHFRFERVSVATSGAVRKLCGIPAHRKIGRAPGSSQAGGRETGSELESGIDGCCWPAVEATVADAVRTAVVTRNYVSK